MNAFHICRKWSIVLATIIILALSKKLELDTATVYMILGFAGAYVGLQAKADSDAGKPPPAPPAGPK